MAHITPAFKRELRAKAFKQAQIEYQRNTATMPSATTDEVTTISQGDIDTFTDHLKASSRILALCGAGLSASSGLPTFRGAGGYWRTYDATSLATPEAFASDPGLVWQFYSYRRHMALRAQPNKAHLALAELARHKPEFLTISQNVDGLSPRAKHPQANLELLHGSLSTVKCVNFDCDYVDHNNFTDPIVPALALPDGAGLDISDAGVPLREIEPQDLPHCPKCKTSLLRPGVVWFGEALPQDTLSRVEGWLSDKRGIDLLVVIGTSASVYPAAGYIMTARAKGARVAVVNTETPDTGAGMLQQGDWFFRGDAGTVVPRIFEGIIGKVDDPGEKL